mgnify:CR=1|tara:strand:+ start:186 stop:926 length:741 start_codon:yes stop_codon:yes gene_type:complete
MKKILLFISLLILLAGGAFILLTGDVLNQLIKEQIETQGRALTEQSVNVANVDMKLLKGTGTIKGLVLNNPTSFSSTPAFTLDEITLDINITSLTSDPIILDKLIINSPKALVEFNEKGRSNIQEILAAINKNLSPSSDSVPLNTNESERRIMVKKFILAGVALDVDLTKLGNTKHTKILPDITLTNIGGETGLPANELGGELLKKALSTIWKAAKKQQKEVVGDKLKDKVKDKISDLFNKYAPKK